jgi:hypothetical protein
LEALEDALSQVPISRALQHQRAFSCLRVLHTALLERIELADMASAISGLDHKELQSREDLARLTRWLHAASEEVAGEQMEFEISRRVLAAGATLGVQQLYNEHREVLQKLIRLYLEACVTLRRALLNPGTRMARIGSCLLKVASVSGFPVQKMLDLPALIIVQTKEVQSG